MTETPLLLIRADASEQIGAGHVMRCLALAQCWQDLGGMAAFVTSALPASLVKRLASEGIESIATDLQAGDPADAAYFFNLANQRQATAVVFDGYKFAADYQDLASSFVGPTLTVDDHGLLPRHGTAFVLDQNLGACEDNYPHLDPQTRLLLGTPFALIRREFRNHPQRMRDRNNSLHRILVTLGGADPLRATETVIHGLQSLPDRHLQFRVIAGFQATRREELLTAIGQDNRFEILGSVDDMAAQYAWADFAIAAGGSSNWEMCLFGLPRAVIVVAENQRKIAAELLRCGASLAAIDASSLHAETITNLIIDAQQQQTLLNCSRAARTLVDGLGPTRVAWRLLGGLKLRPTTIEDLELYWHWVNDPVVRQNSINQAVVPLEDHQRWFQSRLAADSTVMYVAQLNGKPVGQIRFDRNADDQWMIGFSIDESFRGCGLGTPLIDLGVKEIRKHSSLPIVALVKNANQASLACFVSNGFQQMTSANSHNCLSDPQLAEIAKFILY